MFSQVLSKISVLFIVLFIGGIAARKNVLAPESTKALSGLVLIVTLPLLYFHTLADRLTAELLKDIWVLPVGAVFMLLLGYGAASAVARFLPLNRAEKATFIYASTFTNCGFLAIPIANALYGTAGVTRVVFFNLGFNLLLWTLGVWTLRRGGEEGSACSGGIASSLRNIKNSGTIALLAGTVVGLAALKIPPLILDATRIVGGATIPLALLVVGSIMSRGDIRRLRSYRKPIFFIVLCRLIIVPAAALFITGLFGFLPPLVRAIIVLQCAMPSASTTPIFTTRYGGDSHLASAAVFATTACSVITIPLFMSLV